MRVKKREKLLIGALGLFLILAVMPGAAYAQVPQLINYQGFLSDSSGDPVPDGDYDMQFAIYDDSEGGESNRVW